MTDKCVLILYMVDLFVNKIIQTFATAAADLRESCVCQIVLHDVAHFYALRRVVICLLFVFEQSSSKHPQSLCIKRYMEILFFTLVSVVLDLELNLMRNRRNIEKSVKDQSDDSHGRADRDITHKFRKRTFEK